MVRAKEFEQSLRCGLGSAILELKKCDDKAKYHDIVLQCCLRDITHDWQVEGTKGVYLYSAICAAEAREKFEQIIIDRFLAPCRQDTFFYQLLNIVFCYAEDGSEFAKNALSQKYEYFVAKNGRLSKNLPDEYAQWQELVRRLYNIEGFSAFKGYIADISKIFLKEPKDLRLAGDFGWFLVCAEDFFGEKKIYTFLENESKKSVSINKFFEMMKAEKVALEAIKSGTKSIENKKEKVSIEELVEYAKKSALEKNPRWGMSSIKIKFSRNATEEDHLELAQRILKEENETIKALLLMPFTYRGKLYPAKFPIEITPLMEYAKSDNMLLSEIAIECLESFEDKRIHVLALQMLKTKGINSFALGLLKNNYKKTDDEIICSAIKKANTIPHHVQMDMRDIFLNYRGSINMFPALFRVYQKGDCSFCRYGIIEAMERCGVLSNEILEECLYDFYDETRSFAKRIIAKRKRLAEKSK